MGSDEPQADSSTVERARRAVVVPFAVPEDSKDLGLGIAALLHAFSSVFGHNIALAQLLSRDGQGGEPRPIEAFVPPRTWSDLAGAAPPHDEVRCVITGQLEPPSEGRGSLRVLVFEPASGKVLADEETSLTSEEAGLEIVAVIEQLKSAIDIDLGAARDIAHLGWEALESVLFAERCILHNPLRGGAHDRLASLLHLERAVEAAPEANLPAGRLAAVSLDLVLASPDDEKLAAAAERALVRAVADAPAQASLYEALGALHMRRGAVDTAEKYVHAALERAPKRPRLHAIAAEARRARGDLAGAREGLDHALTLCPDDPLLLTERAVTSLEQGDKTEAIRALTAVLGQHPGFPPAFMTLLGIATRDSDVALVEQLACEAAECQDLPSEVARRVLRLLTTTTTESTGPHAEGSGPVGMAPRERAECMVRLASRLVAEGTDAWAELTLARAKVGLGDLGAAREHLTNVESLAPASALAAEACRTRFAIEQPRAARELEDVVRAVHAPTEEHELAALSARAKTLAIDNDVWTAHFALGMAERRRERWNEARIALEAAVSRSPGATPAHLELVAVHVALGSAQKALEHADRACALEGETAKTLAVRATALLAASRHADARETIDRALALDASDANRALSDRIRKSTEPVGALARIRMALGLAKKD